jgi:hypothetical protein
MAPGAPEARHAPHAPTPPAAPRSPAPPAPRSAPGAGGGVGWSQSPAPAIAAIARGECDPVTCRYQLSEGKLDALIELMARDDVPLLISHVGNAIEVQATPEQHRVFEAFCAMIDPGEETRCPYRLSPGKLEALTELMSRSDVPVLISKGEDSITLHGTAFEQTVFKRFLQMIEPGERAGAVSGPRTARQVAAEELARAYAQEATVAAGAHMNELRSMLASHEAQRREWEKRGRELERAAKDLEREADRMEKEAEELQEEAEKHTGAVHAEFVARARAMLEKARELGAEALALESQAEAAEAEAEAMEDHAEAIEQELEAFEAAQHLQRRGGAR